MNGWLRLGAAYGKVPAQPSQFPGGGRTFVPGGPGVVALTNSTLSTPSGSLAVIGRTGLTLGAVGSAAARCMLLLNPYCAGATVILTGYEWLRVKPVDGGLKHDPGVLPETTPGWCNRGSTSANMYHEPRCDFGSSAASMQYSVAAVNTQCLNGSTKFSNAYGEAYTGWATRSYYKVFGTYRNYASNSNCTGDFTTSIVELLDSDTYVSGTATNCPASIDALNPANSIPAGAPVGPDNRCATGRYTSPYTVEQAADRYVQYPKPGASPSAWAADAIAAGETIPGDSLPASGTAPASGGSPAASSSNGTLTTQGPAVSSTTTTSTPATTTTSNGTTTTTPGSTVSTTTTTVPSYTWTFGGDEISYNTTNTTYTCSGAGACSSSNSSSVVTTTTTNGAPSTTAPEPTPDVCKTNPDSSGCAKLGTASGPDWTPTNNNISMTPASAWGAGDSACPAAQTLTLGGFAIPFDNTLMCQFFSGMRFAVLAAASIIAVMIFIGARGGAE